MFVVGTLITMKYARKYCSVDCRRLVTNKNKRIKDRNRTEEQKLKERVYNTAYKKKWREKNKERLLEKERAYAREYARKHRLGAKKEVERWK